MNTPLVTACLIVRNEEAHLPRCLTSVKGLADEIVVHDTGSTDRTLEIARDFGATVSEHPWTSDFAFHRNRAFEMATGRWRLTIDADEAVCDTDIAETRRRLEQDGLPDVLLVRMFLAYPGEKELGFLAPRLTRTSAGIRYRHPIHEQLDITDAAAGLSNLTLDHVGYRDPEALVRKERRNLAIAESMGPTPHGLHSVMRAAFSLGMWSKTIEAAAMLMSSDTSPALKVEACALGAAASLNVKNAAAMTRFIQAGEQLAPTDPDIRLASAVAAVARYDRTCSGTIHGRLTTR